MGCVFDFQGFNGAATAYYLHERVRQLGGNVKITIFEADPQIGG